MELIKFFTYRTALAGGSPHAGGRSPKRVELSGPVRDIMIEVLWDLIPRTQRDNHVAFVVDHEGEQFAYTWSDGRLTETESLCAGDCNVVPIGTTLWNKYQGLL